VERLSEKSERVFVDVLIATRRGACCEQARSCEERGMSREHGTSVAKGRKCGLLSSASQTLLLKSGRASATTGCVCGRKLAPRDRIFLCRVVRVPSGLCTSRRALGLSRWRPPTTALPRRATPTWTSWTRKWCDSCSARRSPAARTRSTASGWCTPTARRKSR
jgi:hypothetical protein